MSAEFRSFLLGLCLLAIGVFVEYAQERLAKPKFFKDAMHRTALTAFCIGIGLVMVVGLTWGLRGVGVFPAPLDSTAATK